MADKHSDKTSKTSVKAYAKTAWKFAFKYRAFVLILIPIFLSIALRMQPAYLPITDNWAENNVNAYYQNQIQGQISQQYPNLPQANRDTLIANEMQKLYATQQDQIDVQISELSQQFRNRFQDEDGQTYLLAIDPYVFYRMTKNYVNYGQPGELEIDGVSYDVLRDGRLLRGQPPQFHAWLMAKIHKIITAFKPDMSIMGSVFLFPVIACTLAVIPAFLLARKLGGDLGGFFAAVITAVHPAVLGRTPAGFSDTDSYNLLFPLLIAWLFIETFESEDIKGKIIYGLLTGFSIGVYSLAWGGWWYLVDLLIITILGYLGLRLIKDRNRIQDMIKNKWNQSALKNSLMTSAIALGSIAFFLVTLNMGFMKYSFKYSVQLLMQFVNQPFAFTQYKAVAVTDIWPNVLTTVAELNLASTSQVMNQLGGQAFFIMAIFSMVLIVFSKDKIDNKKTIYLAASLLWLLVMLYVREKIPGMIFLILCLLPVMVSFFLIDSKKALIATKYGILVVAWVGVTFYAATRGMRFSALIIPGFALALGGGVGVFYKLASDWISSSIDLNKTISRSVTMVLLLLILISPIRSGYATAISEVPSMNDAWYNSLRSITNDSEDSIITSWWDFGHWFTAIAERRVTFDGGSQGKRIHWVGKTLLTGDEEESIGILRMLNCGQELAYYTLLNDTGDKLKSVNMLYDSFKLSTNEARQYYMENGLDDAQADKMITLTHCEPMQQYYIVSDDMVGKSGVWAHFGSWDFTRGSMWNQVHDMNSQEGIALLMDQFGLDRSAAEQYYYEISTNEADQWVSPWPSYASGVGACNVVEGVAQCANGLQLDTATGEAFVSTQTGRGNPVSMVYMDNNNSFTETTYNNAVIPYSAAVFMKDGRPSSIFMDPRLAKSMFTRLFFFGGEGLKHFELLSYQRQVTGGDIYIYRVIWEPDNEPVEQE